MSTLAYDLEVIVTGMLAAGSIQGMKLELLKVAIDDGTAAWSSTCTCPRCSSKRKVATQAADEVLATLTRSARVAPPAPPPTLPDSPRG